MNNADDAKRILEAALLASQEPLQLAELKRLFDPDIGADTIRRLLDELREDWSARAIELVNLASGWRFQTRLDFRPYLERLAGVASLQPLAPGEAAPEAATAIVSGLMPRF